MKYKHIVFDIDGTLIDTEYAVLHSLQETIKELSFISSFFKASVPVIPNANLSSEHGIFLPDNSFIVSCKECNTAYCF